jgi:hypothetical protein
MRMTHQFFVTDLDRQEERAPNKSQAIRTWQGLNGVLRPNWDGIESLVIARGKWVPVDEWTKGDEGPDATETEQSIKELESDLGLDLREGDVVCIEKCLGLLVLGRFFRPYSGTYERKGIEPHEKRSFVRSFVTVNKKLSSNRGEMSAGQVQCVYRITVKRGAETFFTKEVCKITLFQIHKVRLLDGPVAGSGDDAPSRMSIISEPFTIWRPRHHLQGRRNRPRLIALDEIYSACVVVPRVRVATSDHTDLRYHQYHLISLRRE